MPCAREGGTTGRSCFKLDGMRTRGPFQCKAVEQLQNDCARYTVGLEDDGAFRLVALALAAIYVSRLRGVGETPRAALRNSRARG